MSSLISTALVMAGIFVVCYPVVIFLLNRIMANMESNVENNNITAKNLG